MQLITILSTLAVMWGMGVAAHRTVQGQQSTRIFIRQSLISILLMLLIVIQAILSMTLR